MVPIVVFVPNKIMCCMVRPMTGSDTFPCDNKFAHLTLMLGDWMAKESNTVINAIFDSSNGTAELDEINKDQNS